MVRARDWYATLATRPRAGDILDAVFVESNKGAPASDEEMDPGASGAGVQMTARMFFAHVGVTVEEIMAFARGRPFYAEATWFNERTLADMGGSAAAYGEAPAVARTNALRRFLAGHDAGGAADFANWCSYGRLLIFDALAAALRRLYDRRREPEWTGHAARHGRLREQFSPERVAKQVLDLIK